MYHISLSSRIRIRISGITPVTIRCVSTKPSMPVYYTHLTLSGSMKYYALMTVEWIGVVVLHYYLLHRFTRNRSKLYAAEEGFSFGQGYLFVLAVSAFAGVIVGGVQYIYLHLIMGYSNYTSRLVEACLLYTSAKLN